jgi:hypothetical protein
MQNVKVFFKIVTPAILCAFLIVITKIPIEYYPLSFGFVLGILNWNVHKYNSYLGTVLSIIASYTSFFIGYFSFSIITEILKPLFSEDKSILIAMTVSPFIIAPSVAFLLYKFIFNFPEKKVTLIVIVSSIFLLVFISLIHIWNSETIQLEYEFNEILNSYTLWQIVVLLTIQLIIYQKEIWNKQKLE